MKASIIAVLAALLVVGVGGYAFGRWSHKPTLDELAERNRMLAAADTTRRVELEDSRAAYVKLTRDYNDAEDAWAYVTDSLNNVANALKIRALDDKKTIETLVTTNVSLRDSLDLVLGNISVTDSVISAELFTYKRYQDGSIGTEGYFSIYTPEDDEPYGSATLTFDIQMSPTVLLSRDEDTGLAECAISFGDMPVYLKDIECVNNWDVDLQTRNKVNWPTVGVTAGAVVVGGLLLSLVF